MHHSELAQAHSACLSQEKKVVRSRIDVYALFKPLFQGVVKDRPDSLVRVESKVHHVSPRQHKLRKTYTSSACFACYNEDHADKS